MATPEKKEEPQKVTPLLELAKCFKATPPPDPEDYGPIVTFKVGNWDPHREFHVHEGLLSHYSSYFKDAMKDCWGGLKTVDLKDESPEVFQAFFSWIYAGKLYSALDASGKVPLSMRCICEIYVFGDARGAPGLCNAAVDLLIQKMHHEWIFPTYTCTYAYENTLPGSALRKLLVDDAVENYSFADLDDPIQRSKGLETYHKDFLGDMLMAFKALTSSSTGYGTLSYGSNNWATYIKPQICSRYHDHPAPPA